MKLFFLFFLISSCTTTTMREASKSPIFNVVQSSIRPGEVAKISFQNLEEFSDKRLYCKDRYIHSYVDKDKRTAFVSETYFSQLNPFICKIGEKIVARFSIKKKEFPREKLNVAKKMIFPSKKDKKRIQKEQNFLNNIYASSTSYPFFKDHFQLPLNSPVTSIYGTKRIFNNKKRSQHLGTDFKAKIGVNVYSSNAGKVVVARNLYYTGNTVTIDHGLNIFSIYGHLSEIYLKEGEYVPRGIVLGKSGSTGRVTGPHLHWGVKVNGHFIEGVGLLPKLMKDPHKFTF